jgi:hypothetical protein
MIAKSNKNQKEVKMVLEIEKKLKRRKLPTAAITIMCFAVLITTYTIFINLPQSSFAQTATTNANQTTASAQFQAKGVITPCKVTDSTLQGPEYKVGPPFREGLNFAKGIPGERLVLSGRC